MEPMFMRMHHEGGVKLGLDQSGRLDWMALI